MQTPIPLTQLQCDKLRTGRTVLILWRRMRDRSRPGPLPYRITGQFNGHSVIAGETILDNVSLSSDDEKDMVWLIAEEDYRGWETLFPSG